MDISLYTTDELIQEIVNRNTFAGIIIKSATEVRNFPHHFDNWDITYKNLTEKQVQSILEDAVCHFEKLSNEENDA